MVVDLDTERDDTKRTPVVANQTVRRSDLLEHLKEMASEEPRRFISDLPPGRAGNGDGDSEGAADDATERLAHTLTELEDAGLDAEGR